MRGDYTPLGHFSASLELQFTFYGHMTGFENVEVLNWIPRIHTVVVSVPMNAVSQDTFPSPSEPDKSVYFKKVFVNLLAMPGGRGAYMRGFPTVRYVGSRWGAWLQVERCRARRSKPLMVRNQVV